MDNMFKHKKIPHHTHKNISRLYIMSVKDCERLYKADIIITNCLVFLCSVKERYHVQR